MGNTFFTERAPGPALAGYSRTTAQIVAGILARLGPVGVAVGPWDVGPMAPVLAALPSPQREALHLVTAPLAALPQAGRLVALGGLQAGLLAAPATPQTVAPSPPQPGVASGAHSINTTANDAGAAAPTATGHTAQVAALSGEARRLRAAGAAVVLLLWPHGTDQARAQLGELTDVDIIVAGSEEAPAAPQPLGSATLVDGGSRGEHVGLLHLVRGSGGPWAHFDGGAGAKRSAEARRDRLVGEAQRLPTGPGRDARLARAQALNDELAAIVTAPPTTAHFTWEAKPILQSLAAAPWASQALEGYNTALCDSATADTAARPCAPPTHPAGVYVGSGACQGCHQASWAVYQTTSHARAWATLTGANKACDLSCVGCHVVGFEQPGGFCHLADAPAFHNVGCESCHGPGLGHVQSPEDRSTWGPQFVRQTPEATCRGCHNSLHSDQFNFATYLPRVLGPGHGLPILE